MERSRPRKLAPTMTTTSGRASDAWATTRPGIVPVRCQEEKTKYIPMAMTIEGTMSGLRTIAFTRPLPGKRPRTRPKAVTTPRVVATSVAKHATSMLVTAPLAQVGSPKKFWYQWVVKPVGGNKRSSAVDKDIGMTIRVGAAMKPPIKTTRQYSRRRDAGNLIASVREELVEPHEPASDSKHSERRKQEYYPDGTSRTKVQELVHLSR